MTTENKLVEQFRSKLKALFESAPPELELPLGGEESHEDQDPEAEEKEVSAIGGVVEAAEEIKAAADKLKAVEELEHAGVVPEEKHEEVEGQVAADLEAGKEKLETAVQDFKAAETEEGNPAITDAPVGEEEPEEVGDKSETGLDDKIPGDEEESEEGDEEGSEEDKKELEPIVDNKMPQTFKEHARLK